MSAPAAARRTVLAEPLEAAAFRAYGDVIERRSAEPALAINAGTARRFHDLARIDAVARGGHLAISLVRASARPVPFRLECMERHSRGSQAFVPLDTSRWFVIVAPRGRAPRPDQLRAFVASADQVVNYARGTWHHPLLAIDRQAEFLVVDRVADDGQEDCDVCSLAAYDLWIDLPGQSFKRRR
jgi:ureidoglycolate lyase